MEQEHHKQKIAWQRSHEAQAKQQQLARSEKGIEQKSNIALT